MIEVLGPAAGPYSKWLELSGEWDRYRDQQIPIPVFTRYKLERRMADAAVDVAEALLLALDTDMVADHVAEALRGQPNLFDAYEVWRDQTPDANFDGYLTRSERAADIASAVTAALAGRRG